MHEFLKKQILMCENPISAIRCLRESLYTIQNELNEKKQDLLSKPN
jgi:hypothetical protein